jgi:hypothetical protein
MGKIVYWKQRNGVLISVDDMDINHLRNVLKMLIRQNETKNKQIDEYNKQVRLHNARKSSFQLNGDIANLFHESYLSDEDDDRFDEESESNYLVLE